MKEINKKLVEKGRKELEQDKITVGLATCGISAGALTTFKKLKEAGFNVKKTGCIGMCYNEPIVTVYKNEKKEIYGNVSEEKTELLIEFLKQNKTCEELFLANDVNELEFYKKQKRIVMENCGNIEPLNFSQYIASGGFEALHRAVKLRPEKVIDFVLQSKLRGRGGAGFYTGLKWKFIAKHYGKKYLICNGDEGDPGAFMNRTLMESDPFRILEGMIIGAYATGSVEGIIYTRMEYPLAIETLEKAIKILYENDYLGKNILGINGFNFNISIKKGAGAFVCGEETALIASIEGKRGQPRPRPPFPADYGLYGKPTNVNNVGTWAQVTTLFKIGLKNYTSIGTEKTKGTKIICLTGKIKRTGVAEVPFGIKIKDIVYSIGGGCPEGTEFKALLSGGPAGGSITSKQLNTRLDYEDMNKLGTIIGSGGFIVANNKTCMVNISKYFLEFTQSESCGKCVPCREGTKRLLELMTKVTRGVATDKDLENIQELAEVISDASLCGLGQNAPNPILSNLKNFNKEFLMHIHEKKCVAGVCENLLIYTIKDSCIGCGNCARHCPVNAISGKPREKFVIDQSKCIKCGKCFEVCAFDAINKK